MSITENHLSGNWAEEYVAERLAATNCLVRPVRQGRDIGLDLYCETIDRKKPFLHLWVQVKSTKKKIFRPNRHSPPGIKRESVDYWLEQPIPVFVFVVIDRRPHQSTICVYSPLNPNSHRKPFRYLSKLKTDQDMRAFLRNDLPRHSFQWKLNHGVVAPLKNLTNDGQTLFPTGLIQPFFEEKIRKTLLHALWRLAEETLALHFSLRNLALKSSWRGKITKKKAVNIVRPYIQALQSIVVGKHVKFAESLITFGILAELDGDFKKAHECYQKAVSTARKNKDKHWKRKYSKWKKYLARVASKLEKKK